MNFTLTREFINGDGCFGNILSEDNQHIFLTLEHSYIDTDKFLLFKVKIPNGEYTCKRRFSPHFKYDLFELINVPNHNFIEIHVGNYNNESDGCILIGLDRVLAPSPAMLLQSKTAFREFMALQEGKDEFQLTVISQYK